MGKIEKVMQMGTKVVVRLGARPARKATVITNTGATTYLVKYENGELEHVSAADISRPATRKVRR